MIGFGGMGIVYKARHRGLNRLVALKMLRGHAVDEPEFRCRFQTEAEAVARLQHPHIIQVFEIGSVEAPVGQGSARPFIALEYVEGGSLAAQVGTPLPPGNAAALVEKLARATHAAHRVGVIHRDLKPANVLLTTEGEPKIADFGLAKQLSDCAGAGKNLTQIGAVMGTPEYMAPEQAAGQEPTPAVDIYALGVILYELLTGRVPFAASTPGEALALVWNQDPEPPRRLNRTVPVDLETICLKCLEKEPTRRYATAQALADDLGRFRADQPILARRLTEFEKVGRWCRRNPLAAGLLAAVVGVFLVAFVLVTWSYWRSEQARHELAEQRDAAQERERRARWATYRANIAAAANALRVHNVMGARQYLAAAEGAHNWEWQHLQSRLDLAEQVIATRNYCGGSSHPGSGFLLLQSHPDIMELWNFNNRQPRPLVYPRPGEHSPDGRTVAYPDKQGRIVLFDLERQTAREPFTYPANSTHARFSGDGTRLLTYRDGAYFDLWDIATGTCLRSHRLPTANYHSLILSHAGDQLTFGDDQRGQLQLYDLLAGRVIASISSGIECTMHVAFSPDDRRLAVAEGYPSNIVRLFETASGRELFVLRGHTNQVNKLAFSPDSQRLASGSRDQTVLLWDVPTGKRLAALRGHLDWVSSVEFSPDGRRLLTTAHDHTVRVWDGLNGESVAVLHGHTSGVLVATWCDGGRRIASVSPEGSIRLWDAAAVANDGILRGHAGFVYHVAFHPDGERLATASWDGTARLWDATTAQQISQCHHDDEQIVAALAFHPTGHTFATRTRRALRLWDTASGEELHRWEVPNGGWQDTRVAFSPAGDRLATGCAAMITRVYDLTSRREVCCLRGSRNEIRDLAFSPDGRWLATVAGESEPKARIWDAHSGVEVHRLDGDRGGSYSLAYNHQGTLLATGAFDGTVQLWETGTWTQVAVLKHRSTVHAVCFSPDGRRLAAGYGDNSIRLWDVASGEEVVDLRGHTSYVHSVAFSPDGSRLASGSGDGTARIWDTKRPQDRRR